MNISKTNKLGLYFINSRFSDVKDVFKKIKNDPNNENYTGEVSIINNELFKVQSDCKIIRVTNNILINSELINYQKVKQSIDSLDFNFTNMIILMPDDVRGIIKINKFGSDFHFVHFYNLDGGKMGVNLDSYSFDSKNFLSSLKEKESESIVKILVYLFYGEITEKRISPKCSVKINTLKSIKNDTKYGITFADSNWKQRLNVSGFPVIGHFRLQPIGEKRMERKLIWIESFEKKGYNLKAGIERF